MKTKQFTQLFLQVLFLLIAISLYSQDHFWGTTTFGGSGHIGVIFKTDMNGENYSAAYHFDKDNTGIWPESAFTEYNGLLYATTIVGGLEMHGDIYSYDPNTNIYETLFSFQFTGTGREPYSDLYMHNNLFYGTTNMGGDYGRGTIYSFDPDTRNFEVLHHFDNEHGAHPRGTVIAVNNKLYGLTPKGGPTQRGVLYEYDLSTKTYGIKVYYDKDNGANPYGSLIFHNGLLYGMTHAGGLPSLDAGDGTIFKFNPETGEYTLIVEFDEEVHGKNPNGSLIAYNNILYGLTQKGGTNNDGVIFGLDPASEVFTKLYDFEESASGTLPQKEMVIHNGKLYGVTSAGGELDMVEGWEMGVGLLFEFDPDNKIFKKLYDFQNEEDGRHPSSTQFVYGNTLLGNCREGGLADGGVLYAYDFGSSGFTVKQQFSYASKGAKPMGGLIEYEKMMYGLTYEGGLFGKGALYKFDPSGNYTKLVDFDGENKGAHPIGALIKHGSIFYGLCSGGGSNDDGVLFSYDPNTETYSKLNDFEKYSLGKGPRSDLTEMNGIFYGVCSEGGNPVYGTIFSFNPSNNTLLKVADFDEETNGGSPFDVPVVYNDKLYGVTPGYEYSCFGSIYEFDPSNGNIKCLRYIDDPNESSGAYFSTPLLPVNSKLIGFASTGGENYVGLIFEIDPATEAYTVLYDLDSDVTGYNPSTQLVQSDGLYYGSCTAGGDDECGTLFSYDPATNQFIKKTDFFEESGRYPMNIKLLKRSVNNQARIFSFYLPDQTASTVINENERTVSATVKAGTDLTSLSPVLTLSPGATSDPSSGITIDFTNPVLYTITAEDGETIAEWIVSVTHTSGIDDAEQVAFSVYPNPTNSFVSLQLAVFSQQSVVVEIYDFNGRKMIEQFISKNTDIVEIDVNKLVTGIYFCKVVCNNASTTKKLIIQK